MNQISRVFYVFLSCLFVYSCSKTGDNTKDQDMLSSYLENKKIELGAVIACSASNDQGEVLTFFYPEANSSNPRLYQMKNEKVKKEDFTNYTRVFETPAPIFNGYLRHYTQKLSLEKWMIVTYELDGEVRISNPIRSKQLSKATIWHDKVTIDQTVSGMPEFSWEDNAYGDNAIYFQVVSDANDNLLSGTYTNDNYYQYYITSNIILNITTLEPPNLMLGKTYKFTLMDVSEDNWVNAIIFNKNFTAE